MRVHTASDLGALIRERRRELRLTQQALADRIGTSRVWVSEVEQGKPSAEAGLVLRALAALGVSLRVDVAAAAEAASSSAVDGLSVDIDAIIQRASK